MFGLKVLARAWTEDILHHLFWVAVKGPSLSYKIGGNHITCYIHVCQHQPVYVVSEGSQN